MGYLIQSSIEYFAKATPKHPALSYQGEEMSYRELDNRSNQLAHALLANGAKPQDRVAIYLHKSLELGVAIYGILKAGCVFVPIDPFVPEKRLAFILDDCGIQHTICSDALLSNLEQALANTAGDIPMCIYGPCNPQVSIKQTPWSETAKFRTGLPDLSIIDQDLAYIMYTSGSTGVPKGMMHSHLGSNTYARWGANHVSLSASDRVASHAPLHFDLSIFDFFSTARSGATVILVPEAVTRMPASWTKTIESEKISVVFTVPFTLISMLEQGAMDQRDLSSLRWILYGGEPFPPKILRRLMLKLSKVKFSNIYGPAESPSCTCFDISIPAENSSEPIPIGAISRNSSGIIVDELDRDCENGEAGELCIRSSSLTLGYWNRPDLNEKAYLMRSTHGPFPQVFFRTGDRVIRRADGNLDFVGRVDRMVKIRGQRVELDEVELVLAGHESVVEAAAFTVPDETSSQSIFAAVSAKPGIEIDETILRDFARSQLPNYAVPLNISVRTALPHNSSGKIDRKLLREQWTNETG